MARRDFSKEFKSYWERVSQNLTKYVESKRVREVEHLINGILSFFAFSTEDLSAKATKNTGDLNKLNTFILLAIDSMRGTLRCQEELSLIGLALLQRTAFEIHCNLLYMFNHANPSQMIDRNYRFNDIERLKQSKQSANVPLRPGEEAAIKAQCPEWLSPSGNLVKNPHWTAEPGKNLREIAKAVGKEDMYISLYATNSKFAHGSNIVSNLYRDDKMQLHFNGRPNHCARMAILTCQFWLETIEVHFAFFGIPFQQNDLQLVRQNILAAMDKYM